MAIALAATALLCVAAILAVSLWRFTPVDLPFAYGSETYRRQRDAQKDEYYLRLKIDVDSMTADFAQEMLFWNRTEAALEEVAFSLPANAFADVENPPFAESDMPSAYPLGWSEGGLTFSNIRENGENAVFSAQGETLRVKLREPLEPGASLRLEMKAVLAIPPARAPFGYSRSLLQLADFYALPMDYRDGVWFAEPYSLLPEMSSQPHAYYEATVEVPADVTVALPGTVQLREEDGKRVYVAENFAARDFALTASRNYHLLGKTVGDVNIRVYCLSRPSGEKALEAAAKAVEAYTEAYGRYPYPELVIAETDSLVDMKAHSGLVQISTAYFEREAHDKLAMLVARGVALQWTGHLAGGAYTQSPWMVLTPALSLVIDDFYGGALGAIEAISLSEWVGYGLELPLESHLLDFPGRNAYESLYSRGYALARQLRDMLGEDLWRERMRGYFEEYAFRAATAENLIQALSAGDLGVEAFLRDMLAETGG